VAGRVTTLPTFHILPPPPPEQFVPIANETADQVVTDPRYPGLSITLPAGVTITGWDGVRKTQIALDRLSPDRLPVPPPPGPTRSLYRVHFGTPMGGLPSAPLPVTLPNDQDAEPGEQVEVWYYDAAPFGGVPAAWRLAGLATVSEDGTRVVSDHGVGIERFCGVCGITCFIRNQTGQPNRNPGGGAAGGGGGGAAGAGPGGGGPPKGGDPVDLALGQHVVEKTDLVIPGRIPVMVHRTYNPFDAFGRIAGFQLSLGPSWAFSVDIALLEINSLLRRLILPGNARFDFTGAGEGRFVNTTSSLWAGAVLGATGTGGHELRLKDGTVWRFATGWLPLGAGRPVAGLGLLVEQIDRLGNRLTVTRARWGAVSRITGPGDRSLAFTLDSNTGLVRSVQDASGRMVQYGYDATGRLATVTDPAGGATRYTFNAAGGIVTITDAAGNIHLSNEYDTSGRVLRQIQADGGAWSFSYEGPVGAHTGATVTDPRGGVTTYRMTAGGFANEVVDALGQTTRFTRDARGQLNTVTDALGRVTRFDYDDRANIARVSDASGHSRSFVYEPTFNRMTTFTDQLDHITRFEHDAHGNLTDVVDPTGARTTLGYDASGRLLEIADPMGGVARLEYDGADNLTVLVDPSGNRTAMEHDATGRVVRHTDPIGRTTAFTYDAMQRIAATTDALGGVTRFTYDANGNLLSVTDARGHTTTLGYDPMDRLVSRTDPLGTTESFAYDGAGNLARLTDRKGQTTILAYDGLNRPVTATYGDGTGTTWSYDAAGRVPEIADSVGGMIVNEYDELDRLVAQTTPLGAVRYQYNARGARTQMDVPGRPPVNYAYDAASRLREILQGPQVVSLEYDAQGRRTRLVLPNAVSTEYQYDPASRVTALLYRNSLGPIGDLTFRYDPAGNRIAVGGSFARMRLPDAVPTSMYDSGNRQLAFGQLTLTYDANGNPTTMLGPGGATTLAWDARNRLVGVGGADSNSRFVYDALGRRLMKEADGRTTRYLYDGVDLLQESAETGDHSYLRTLNIDEPLVRDGVDHYLADTLLSTIALTDPSGTIQTEYTYEPFGTTVSSGSPSGNSFQFTARENDGGGLYYYRARYYSPALHRFVGPDPLDAVFVQLARQTDRTHMFGTALSLILYTQTQTLNGFSYVTGNPVTLRDPLGLINFLIGTGGSLVGVTGGEASAGIVFNLGFWIFGCQADVGLFGSAGPAGGVNVSGDVFVGFVLGGMGNVPGTTVNANVAAGPVSVTVFFDPASGRITGGTIGAGPTAGGAGASISQSNTGIVTLGDALGHPRNKKC